MRTIRRETTFKKDYKRCRRRYLDIAKLGKIITILQNNQPLPAAARPHKLIGNYSGFSECHIEPDWLLIYRLTDTEILLHRTGTHADLFK